MDMYLFKQNSALARKKRPYVQAELKCLLFITDGRVSSFISMNTRKYQDCAFILNKINIIEFAKNTYSHRKKR